MPRTEPIRVLFVCLGNICRSPLAEGVFREQLREAGLSDRFEVDSAGTSGYHVGDRPDARTAEEARRRGLTLSGRARRMVAADLDRFDYVIAMDADNLRRVEALAERRGAAAAELRLLREWDPRSEPGDDGLGVPDPYYGGPGGFAEVHDIVERSCRGLLDHIRERHGL
ncbi:MAG: low molecular weight protein-tyrosine-phosphatase [Longimicrobiales bacterium]